MSLPDPMVPPEVDLRDFAFMPLDVLRLRDSELASVHDPEVFRAAVLSWCVGWHQVPAASLPDDDVQLARLLGYGRDVKGWQKVRKAGGLRGWVPCSDGRIYHPVVSEKARDAWTGKLMQRWRTEAARVKKHNQRHELEGAAAVRMPEFEQWRSLGCPQGQPLHVPETGGKSPKGQAPNVPRETASKGEGEGQGEGQGQGEGDLKGREAPQAARRGSRLPPDWEPGEPGMAFAAQQGLTNGRATAELAKFRDFWVAKTGANATKADWQATWRNWVRRAVESAPQGQQRRSSVDDEPEWRREQRERNEAFLGPAAAKRRRPDIIDMEASDATPRIVG